MLGWRVKLRKELLRKFFLSLPFHERHETCGERVYADILVLLD